MVFSEMLKNFCVGEMVPYRNASGELTGKGSFVIVGITASAMEIKIPNGNTRPLRESDWNEVIQNLIGLQKSRKVCQLMKTKNTTYILSLRWSPKISALFS